MSVPDERGRVAELEPRRQVVSGRRMWDNEGVGSIHRATHLPAIVAIILK
jgi:hypothetical protein